MNYQPTLFEPPTRRLFPGRREPARAFLLASHEENRAAIQHGYHRLALAIIRRAVKDARRKGPTATEARYWLAKDAPTWFELLGVGVQPKQYQEWLAAGCPGMDPEGGEDD
jgi:hypothetical protein